MADPAYLIGYGIGTIPLWFLGKLFWYGVLGVWFNKVAEPHPKAKSAIRCIFLLWFVEVSSVTVGLTLLEDHYFISLSLHLIGLIALVWCVVISHQLRKMHCDNHRRNAMLGLNYLYLIVFVGSFFVGMYQGYTELQQVPPVSQIKEIEKLTLQKKKEQERLMAREQLRAEGELLGEKFSKESENINALIPMLNDALNQQEWFKYRTYSMMLFGAYERYKTSGGELMNFLQNNKDELSRMGMNVQGDINRLNIQNSNTEETISTIKENLAKIP